MCALAAICIDFRDEDAYKMMHDPLDHQEMVLGSIFFIKKSFHRYSGCRNWHSFIWNMLVRGALRQLPTHHYNVINATSFHVGWMLNNQQLCLMVPTPILSKKRPSIITMCLYMYLLWPDWYSKHLWIGDKRLRARHTGL